MHKNQVNRIFVVYCFNDNSKKKKNEQNEMMRGKKASTAE